MTKVKIEFSSRIFKDIKRITGLYPKIVIDEVLWLPIPKFLGGSPDQVTVKIPQQVHMDFHSDLAKSLKDRFGLPVGGTTGSTDAWRDFFKDTPGTQQEAFDRVKNLSQAYDSKYGTNILYHANCVLNTPKMVTKYP